MIPTSKRRALAVLAFLCGTVLGCERGVPDLEVRTFPLSHIDGYDAAIIIDPYVYGERPGAEGRISPVSGAITVRETRDNLDQIARVLAQYDVPRPDLRLHFQLIQADGYEGSDPQIAEVEQELRRIFQFSGYRLAGEAVVSASGGSEIDQRLRGPAGTYSITAAVQWFSQDLMRLEEVRLVDPDFQPILQTTVNVRPGQTLVLGSTPQGNAATLLLTVRAEAP